jgi:ribosomal protein L14
MGSGIAVKALPTAISLFVAHGASQRAALIRQQRLPRCQGQTIGFDEHAVVLRLRPGKKADKHEGSAEHQPYQHHPTVRAFVVKIHDTHQQQ